MVEHVLLKDQKEENGGGDQCCVWMCEGEGRKHTASRKLSPTLGRPRPQAGCSSGGESASAIFLAKET